MYSHQKQNKHADRSLQTGQLYTLTFCWAVHRRLSSSPCGSLVTKTSALAKEWETILCMRLSVSCDTQQFGMCLGLSLAHCVCCTIIGSRNCICTEYRESGFLRNELWGWHIHKVVFEHIGRSWEVFICGSLFLFGARPLLGHVFKIPCRIKPYTHHTHSLRPPLVLVHAAHNCFKVWPVVFAVHFLKKIKPSSTSFTSLKLWRNFFQCVLLYTYLIRWCNGLLHHLLQYPFLPSLHLTLLSHQWCRTKII